jgi:catechol 2,3-dioxygenase-like lactoylglutathione lyase family enzyme
MSVQGIDGLGVKLQPMVHVADMGEALAFYTALGATLVFGSRDQDWALLDFGGARMGLLAHPPGDGKKETVELQFTSERPLEEVEARMRALGADGRRRRGVRPDAEAADLGWAPDQGGGDRARSG